MGRRSLVIVALSALLVACNGSNTVPPPVVQAAPTPTPTPTPGPASSTATLTTSMTASSSAALGPIAQGQTATAACPPSTAVSHLTTAFSLTKPATAPTVADVKRVPKTIGGSNITTFGFLTVTPSVTVTCPNTPAFTMTFPAGVTVPTAASSYVAMYDPNNAGVGWNTISGPAVQSGSSTLSWPGYTVPYPLVAGTTYVFVLFTTSSTLAVATPSPTPTPTATPVPLHLYVGNDGAPGSVLQFNLPLTASSTSNFGVVSNDVVAVAVDANGNLVVGNNVGSLQFFSAPLSAASVPAATFTNGAASNNGQAAFDASGNFWAAGVSNRVNRFNSPFSNASAPATFVTDAGMVSDIGVAFDAAQNLYISNAGTGTAGACAGTSQPGGGCGSNIYVYAPPYTGAPIITPSVINFPFAGDGTAYRKIAVSGTQLFATSVSGSPGRVDLYTLPITAASTPASSFSTGVNTPEGIALDPSGNLYVGNLGDATVSVYSPPFSSGSVPSLIFKVNTGAFAIFGIAVGK